MISPTDFKPEGLENERIIFCKSSTNVHIAKAILVVCKISNFFTPKFVLISSSTSSYKFLR